MSLTPLARRLMRIGFYLSLAINAAICSFYCVLIFAVSPDAAMNAFSASGYRSMILFIAFLATLFLTMVSEAVLLVYAHRDDMHRARLATRGAIVFLTANFLLSFMITGVKPIDLLYLFQYAVLLVFQLSTDNYLARTEHFENPFPGWFKKRSERRADREQKRRERIELEENARQIALQERRERQALAERNREANKAARQAVRSERMVAQKRLERAERRQEEEEYYQRTGKTLKGYIPLNFFNLFWIFFVASIIGLVLEIIWHALVLGGYEDRAGLLWGPFSPIYGCGAVLLTIALNRFWQKSKIMIFLVSGVIGAAFEFFVSYFMEYSFGIVAWDYSGTFLSLDGRTNFAFFCMWGFLGLVWIKLILPDVLKIVDLIPLKWRTALTVAAAAFMIADAAMTLVALDCWYQREAGMPAVTSLEEFCADHFDDDYMAERFQSMTIDPDNATRLR